MAEETVSVKLYNDLLNRYETMHETMRDAMEAKAVETTAIITNLERDKEAVQPLRRATKLRFLLERLEMLGKEPGMSFQDWWEKGRPYKWNLLIADPGRYACLRQFVECIGDLKNFNKKDETNEKKNEPNKKKKKKKNKNKQAMEDKTPNDTIVIESILSLYKMCDNVIHGYFFGGPVDFSVLQNPRIRKVAECLILHENDILSEFSTVTGLKQEELG